MSDNRSSDFIKGLFIGGLMGAVLGILYAPKSGKETREDIARKADELITKAKEEKSYVLTSGTGSGKSLTYIVPIVDHVLRKGLGNGIQAIVVYPMNALANSQNEELAKFLKQGYEEGKSGITCGSGEMACL